MHVWNGQFAVNAKKSFINLEVLAQHMSTNANGGSCLDFDTPGTILTNDSSHAQMLPIPDCHGIYSSLIIQYTLRLQERS